MSQGGYILNRYNMPVPVIVVPPWEQEVDVHGRAVHTGNGDGGCLGKLIVATIAIALGLIAAVATVFGGVVLLLYARIFGHSYRDKELRPFTFSNGLVAMYRPIFVCQVLWFVFGLILLGFYKLGWVPAFLDDLLAQDYWYQSLIMSYWVCLVPALLLAATSLQKRLRFFPAFNGFLGYLLALFLLLLSMVCGFVVMGWALKMAMTQYPEFAQQVIDISPRQFFPGELD